MCGIHGIFTGGKHLAKADGFISDAFITNSVRGLDSAGLLHVDVDFPDKYEVHKLPINGSLFIDHKQSKSLISKANTSNTLTLCHVRAATHGSITWANAHPFIVFEQDATGNSRSLVGVHNGSLTGWHSKPRGKDYAVDSEWALNHIFDNGADAFKDFVGAYCFAWWDSNNEEILNIALNDQRPMCVAFIEDGGMAFASEAGMLYWLLERNNIKIKGSIIKLTAGHWYKFRKGEHDKFTKELLPTNTVPSSYTPHKSKTVMQEVEELISRISAGKSTALVAKSAITGATNLERESARALEMLNRKAVFFPEELIRRNEGSSSMSVLKGTCTFEGSLWDAEIRGAEGIKWEKGKEFTTKILGVNDPPAASYSTDVIVVLSKPLTLMAVA